MTILDKLASLSLARVEEAKRKVSLVDIRKQAQERYRYSSRLSKTENVFLKALKKEGLSVISEIKKASPSKGVIDPVFDYEAIAAEYIAAKTDAISVLTEPHYFLGSDAIFSAVREKSTIPMIRKDFTVDSYQIYESKVMGADAILLIVALLEKEQLEEFLAIAHEIGLVALVETHTEEEIEKALALDVEMIGVNNRNLKDFSVDFSLAKKYRKLIPREKVFVAESGITSIEDVAALKMAGADAILVGEFLMRAKSRAELLAQMKGL